MLSAENFTSVFLPEAMTRLGQIKTYARDLVHYTSATNALRILRNKRVTLRNVSLMNDFSEVDHGEKCLVQGWHSTYGRGNTPQYNGQLSYLLNSISPTIVPAIEQAFDSHKASRGTETFLLSLSEHNDLTEGKLGKLSMWRAYGGKTNVAIVVDPGFLFAESNTGAFSAPVIYSKIEEFAERHFSKIVDSMKAHINILRSLDRDYIVYALNSAFNYIALATKHPGFAEEQEWRIVFAPWLDQDANLQSEIIDIAGVPQRVYYIDLSGNQPAHSPSVQSLVKKIIIGPTDNPWVLYDAFVSELESAGVHNAATKVVISDIPIRR